MTITKTILKQLENQRSLHFALLDPDKQTPGKAGELAKNAENAGSSAIMVGGSTLTSQQQVDETVKAIKKETTLPVILFPSAAKFLSPYADGLFFMSLLNSRNLDFLIREHVKGAYFVKKSGIEPISMGYVIVEPGMTAGKMGEVDLIRRNDYDTVVGYALSTQFLGMNFFYLEAGSGAPFPIPNDMIKAVKKNIDIPLIVGGGIRSVKMAKQKSQAGADIIVTGTAIETEKNVEKALKAIVNELRI